MKTLYEKLYEDCQASETFFQDAHFVPIQGEYYQKNSRKFMLIGRAANGWESLSTDSKDAFGNAAESQFKDYDRWNWIENVNGTLYCSGGKEKNLSKRYCIDKKPYWVYTKSIWEQLSGIVHDDVIWQKNIVWSNLYKVSPLCGDNPNWKSIHIQQDVCIQILKKELA